MWGIDYPHNEGTSPYSRASLRRTFHDWTPEDLRQIFSGTAAEVYGFDLAEARPDRGRASARRSRRSRVPLDAIPKGAFSPAFWR